MLRTNDAAVRVLCPTELPDLSGPLQSAQLLVDRLYGASTNDEQTELIERYLAAHFTALLDPREREVRSALGMSITFEGRMTSEGLTTYAVVAVHLDTTGQLARLLKGDRSATMEIF